jgi:hypothetical protein
VAGDRRAVRVPSGLLDDLDRVLGEERGPDGEPSTNDFVTVDLLPLIDTFAEDFDLLPELFPGDSKVRYVVSASVFFAAVLVVGRLADDGAIELASISFDDG